MLYQIGLFPCFFICFLLKIPNFCIELFDYIAHPNCLLLRYSQRRSDNENLSLQKKGVTVMAYEAYISDGQHQNGAYHQYEYATEDCMGSTTRIGGVATCRAEIKYYRAALAGGGASLPSVELKRKGTWQYSSNLVCNATNSGKLTDVLAYRKRFEEVYGVQCHHPCRASPQFDLSDLTEQAPPPMDGDVDSSFSYTSPPQYDSIINDDTQGTRVSARITFFKLA